MHYSIEFLEQIYDECLNLPEAKRLDFIEQSCGENTDLKTVLLRMLSNNNNAINYFQRLQQDVIKGIQDEPIPELTLGESVGNYRVVSFLAKGGMSNVYLAERADGQFEQKVAIKCLASGKFGKDKSLQQISEQQILAKLRHPNIATLYDAGITSTDIPYFIMEYIDGKPVDEYVLLHNFNLDKRLLIFEQIADAVAYAHTHLILHLDLKPGNILVNEEGHVNLLDFGIATTFISEKQFPSSFLGTPLIVAPEQITGELLTAATDVYQLGMLLHKLISDKLPYSNESEPSEGITGNNLKEKIQTRTISTAINFELQAILRKCLDTNPENRYASVLLLLQDIRNYRNYIPVTAISPSVKYRLSKFARRNRTAVISILLIALSLVVGTAASLWQAHQAQQQRDLALKSEQISVLTKNFLLDLFMAAHPSVNKGDTMSVFQFLDKGYEKAGTYSGSPEIKLEMLTTMSKLYRTLGDFSKSKAALQAAFQLSKDSSLPLSANYIQAEQQFALYQRDKGNYDSAYLLMNQVLQMYADINYPEKDSIYTASLKYQSFICKQLEKTDSAILLINKAILLEEQLWPKKDNINLAESYYVLGVIYNNQAKTGLSIEYLSKSLEICEKNMGEFFPGTLVNQSALINVLMKIGNNDKALMHSRKALKIAMRLYGAEHRETATTLDNTGILYTRLKNYDSAYYNLKRALDIRQKIYVGQKNQFMIFSNNNLLSLFIETRQADSAMKYLSQALIIGDSDKVHERQRAVTYNLAGDYYQQLTKPDSAYYYYQKSIAASKTYLPETDERIVSVKEKLDKLK